MSAQHHPAPRYDSFFLNGDLVGSQLLWHRDFRLRRLVHMSKAHWRCVSCTACAPSATVRKAIDVLMHLSKSVSLFTVEHFRQTVGPAFSLALVDVLLSRTHPLLRDDICSLLYEMTVGTDPDTAIAHPILVHISGLSDVQKAGLMQTFPSDRDAPNFVKGLKAFLGDVEYLRLCNEAVGAS